MTDKSIEALTATEAAEIIRKGPKKVRELMNNGSLPFIRFPGDSRRYILRCDLVEFMHSLRQDESGN